MPEGRFFFLGYEFLTLYSFKKRKKRKKYIETRPFQKKITRLMEEFHDLASPRMGLKEASQVVKELNRKARGQANYLVLEQSQKRAQSLPDTLRAGFANGSEGGISGGQKLIRATMMSCL
jgi:hypothetical protein